MPCWWYGCRCASPGASALRSAAHGTSAVAIAVGIGGNATQAETKAVEYTGVQKQVAALDGVQMLVRAAEMHVSNHVVQAGVAGALRAVAPATHSRKAHILGFIALTSKLPKGDSVPLGVETADV